MKNIALLVFLFPVLLLGACSGNQPASEENPVTAAREEAAAEKTTNTTTDLVNEYVKLKDALVASDASQAKQVATGMLEVIDAIQMPEIQLNIKEISATADLSVQRTYFDSLSMNVYHIIKTAEGDLPTLYWQFCPMAFNNQGAYWLSFQEEIRNPYYGDQMLTCGRVEEEIK